MSATAPEAPVEEIVDLSDLDMLDDPNGHVYCSMCLGHTAAAGEVVPTVCGSRMIAPLTATAIECEPCAQALVNQVCPVHGYVGP